MSFKAYCCNILLILLYSTRTFALTHFDNDVINEFFNTALQYKISEVCRSSINKVCIVIVFNTFPNYLLLIYSLSVTV